MTDQRVSVHPDFQRNSWLCIAPTWRQATDIVSKFDEPSPPRGFAFAFFWKVQNTKPDDNDLCAGVVYSETMWNALQSCTSTCWKFFALFCHPDGWLCQPSILCQGNWLLGPLPFLPSGVILRPGILDMPKCPKPWAAATKTRMSFAGTTGLAHYRKQKRWCHPCMAVSGEKVSAQPSL